MQKTNNWWVIILTILIITTLLVLFLQKPTDTEKLKLQNDLLKGQLNEIKYSMKEMEENLTTKLNKVDSNIAVSRKLISGIENNVANMRTNIRELRQATPEAYYNSLTEKEKENFKKIIYKDVVWE